VQSRSICRSERGGSWEAVFVGTEGKVKVGAVVGHGVHVQGNPIPKALVICNWYKKEKYFALVLTVKHLDFNYIIVPMDSLRFIPWCLENPRLMLPGYFHKIFNILESFCIH